MKADKISVAMNIFPLKLIYFKRNIGCFKKSKKKKIRKEKTLSRQFFVNKEIRSHRRNDYLSNLIS